MRGFSLIETVLYVGLLAIILPVFALMFLQLTQQYQALDPRVRMEERSAMLHDQLFFDLASSTSVDTTLSSLEVNPSRLEFLDDSGQRVRVEVVEQTIDFSGTDQQVRRLRYEVGSSQSWVTDHDMDVSEWVVEPVRDASGVLTGLNVHLTIQMLEASGVYRETAFEEDLTVSLSAHTTEI